MTHIDGTPGRWRPWLPGTTVVPAEELAAAYGCTVPEAVAHAVLDAHANLAPSVDGGVPSPGRPGVVAGQGVTRPSAPTIAFTYTDPDGDRLTLLALHERPADWSLVLTTADGEVERDVLIEDDETLAGFGRGLLGAIEDRPR